MHTQVVTEFGEQVRLGLTRSGQKTLPTKYLYDDVGSALFDAITALEEYGLTRADLRLLRRHARDIAGLSNGTTQIAELGSGNGSKTRALLEAFPQGVKYRPVDLSRAALEACRKELAAWPVEPVEADFLHGLEHVASTRQSGSMLVLFLGSNIGNFERDAIPGFLHEIRTRLRVGDGMLLGADLLKPVRQLVEAYDDPAGVTAAFNRNLLARVNRQMGANFELRRYGHEARWNESKRRIEMHLCARTEQRVRLEELGLEVLIRAGETIHTESSHKFEIDELRGFSQLAGFSVIETWQDAEWPFAEMLLRAV
ncbi:MAG: L-histidine N(alpha)-methyltransferase [Bryobacteraceae bacterium]|nr:L-histidine N(alpha)-methyltransferase [Bryobacteraceae bacterium]